MEYARVLNVAYLLLVRSVDDKGRAELDSFLNDEPDDEPTPDDDDWVPDWWIEDPQEAMKAHQAHMAQYQVGGES